MSLPPPEEPVFVDRRKMPEDLRSVMASEFTEWNRRRDDNLRMKMEAMEKFGNLSMTTRADALNIAITRVQGDNAACSMRCSKQVAEFYNLINALEKDYVREFEKFKAHECVSSKAFTDVETELKVAAARSARHRKELDTKIDSAIKDVAEVHKTLVKRVETLENWRALDWKQTLIYAAAALIGLIQLLTWAEKFIRVKLP